MNFKKINITADEFSRIQDLAAVCCRRDGDSFGPDWEDGIRRILGLNLDKGPWTVVVKRNVDVIAESERFVEANPFLTLLEIMKVCEAATEGPWTHYQPTGTGSSGWIDKSIIAGLPIHSVDRTAAFLPQDATFICVARRVMPKLVAIAEAAKRYKELPMSDDDNRRLWLAFKALEQDTYE